MSSSLQAKDCLLDVAIDLRIAILNEEAYDLTIKVVKQILALSMECCSYASSSRRKDSLTWPCTDLKQRCGSSQIIM